MRLLCCRFVANIVASVHTGTHISFNVPCQIYKMIAIARLQLQRWAIVAHTKQHCKQWTRQYTHTRINRWVCVRGIFCPFTLWLLLSPLWPSLAYTTLYTLTALSPRTRNTSLVYKSSRQTLFSLASLTSIAFTAHTYTRPGWQTRRQAIIVTHRRHTHTIHAYRRMEIGMQHNTDRHVVADIRNICSLRMHGAHTTTSTLYTTAHTHIILM